MKAMKVPLVCAIEPQQVTRTHSCERELSTTEKIVNDTGATSKKYDFCLLHVTVGENTRNIKRLTTALRFEHRLLLEYHQPTHKRRTAA